MIKLGNITAGSQYDLPTATIDTGIDLSLAEISVSLYSGPVEAPTFEILKSWTAEAHPYTELDLETGELEIRIVASDWEDLPDELKAQPFDLYLQIKTLTGDTDNPGPFYSIGYGFQVKPRR